VSGRGRCLNPEAIRRNEEIRERVRLARELRSAVVPGLKGLPVVERCGALVRTKITDTDRLGGMVADCFHPYADGQLVAATVVEAINATRESGIGPAEMRRQRDELLAALKDNQVVGLTEFLDLVRDFTEPHRGAPNMSAEQLHLRALRTIEVVREARAEMVAAIAKAEGRQS
jgi:hypothetical protein